ncbi:MAG: hypothetical protein SWY16_13025 [Cyanobacteriota bacterium]|nr:hypothetical protein [Cyanobacteriota bacterium]
MSQAKGKKRQLKKLWQFLLLLGFALSIVLGGYGLYRTYPNSTVSASNSGGTCGSPSGGITDNPIATRYGRSAYPWSDRIRWQCVYHIDDFAGNTPAEQFVAARDAAARDGGGVVYFPSGTYEFDDDLFLKNGVVIRGETPTATIDAKDGRYAPPTKFIFPQYRPQLSGRGTPNDTAFKKITTLDPDGDRNIGIVNIDLDRAAISLLGDIDAGEQQNIIVFGTRSNNVAQPDPKVPDLSFQEPWMRYSYRFAANIKINAARNILVANNRINDAITDNYDQPGYRIKSLEGNAEITYRDGRKVPFHYGNHYGIVLNRSKQDGFEKAATPQTEPGLFRSGIVVRDNWVYHTMRVAISASGDGLVVRDNQIADEPNKQWWTDPTGTKEARGSVTLENRAIDWSGWNVEIEGNRYQVYRHKIRDTGYLSVDGEGILIQECCGGTTVRGALIAENVGNSYIGLYKVRDIRDAIVRDNQVNGNPTNTESIYVVADTNANPYRMENVTIENNQITGGILVKASAGGSNNRITNNRGDNSGAIEFSCHVTTQSNRGFQTAPCLSES